MSLYFQPTTIRTQDFTMPIAPDDGLDIPSLIDSLTNRVASSEKNIEQKVSTNALAKILLTENDIFLMADKISLIGQINMFDWVRDISGNITGGVDPSNMTRIVGGKIQTGVIESTNWTTTTGSRIDLNNGNIVLGGSSAPKFSVSTAGVVTCQDAIVHGTLQANSVIANSCTVDGVAMNTIKTGAANGTTALTALPSKLEASTSYILTGVVQPTDSGAIKVGSITWDSSTGALTGGAGIAITEYGIIGAKLIGGVSTAQFAIDTSGSATFSGTVSAGAVTSSTYIDVTGYVKSTGLITLPVTIGGDTIATSIYGAMPSAVTSGWSAGIVGHNSSTSTAGLGYIGVYGIASNTGSGFSYGVYGEAQDVGIYGRATGTTSDSFGIYASAAGSAYALYVEGLMGVTSSSKVSNLQADSVDGTHIGSISTGTGTASFPSTNKPGGSTSNTWLTIVKDGTTYYLPAWT